MQTKILYTLLMVCFFTTVAFSQSYYYKNTYGKIVTVSGDTLEGYINFATFGYSKIKFRKTISDKKLKIERRNIKNIFIENSIYTKVLTMSYMFDDDEESDDGEEEAFSPNLMRQVIKGNLSLYILVERFAQYEGGVDYIDRYYVKESDGNTAERIGSLGFKRNIKKYIGDCELVLEKVLDKTYRFKDLPQIVKEYNQCLILEGNL